MSQYYTLIFLEILRKKIFEPDRQSHPAGIRGETGSTHGNPCPVNPHKKISYGDVRTGGKRSQQMTVPSDDY